MFKKTPKQIEATKLQALIDIVCLGGGSRSGKTFITVRNILARAILKPSRHLIGRLHFNHVKNSIGMDTLPKVQSICFPHVPMKMNKTDWYLELPNGSQVWLVGTDDADRVEKILGTEYSTLYFNEASQFTSYETIALLQTRLAENSGLPLREYYDCNPPSKKHWLYKKFILGVEPDTGKPIRDWDTTHKYLSMNPHDNLENLPQQYLRKLETLPAKQRERFLLGLFSDDNEGALWSEAMIEAAQQLIINTDEIRTVVGVDPAVTNNPDSDEWGIVVCSAYEARYGRVIADYSAKNSTDASAQAVMDAYTYHDADAVVVEVNQGGDLVENVLRLKGFEGKIIPVRASKGKFARAEPVSALYEQGKIRHEHDLGELEDEMTGWVAHDSKESPNRIDAMVWAFFELFQLHKPAEQLVYANDILSEQYLGYKLNPVKGHIVMGWSTGQTPAVVILQKTNNNQIRLLDAIQATNPGFMAFVRDVVHPLLVTRYRKNPYVSIGSRRGIERSKGSSNERAAFDILHDFGIETEPALDEGDTALIETSRRMMSVMFKRKRQFCISSHCKGFTDMANREYVYNDKMVAVQHPLAEAFQYAALEMERGEIGIEQPVFKQQTVIDEEIGY